MSEGRKLSLGLAIALVAGNMIGSGIYLLPASLAATGSSSIIAWAVALVGALVLAAVFSRLAVQLPASTGGALDWVRDAFGAPIGFVNAAIYWMTCPISVMAISLAVTGYVGSLVPALVSSPFATVSTAIAAIWAMICLNLFGPRLVARTEAFALILGLLPVFAVALLGWAWFDAQAFSAAWNPSGEPVIGALPTTVLNIFWAFLGFESAIIVASLVDRPDRNLPRATIGGVALAGAIYIAACAAMMGIVPLDTLGQSTAPFAAATAAMFGAATGMFVALCATLKALGTLAGWVLMTGRTLPGADGHPSHAHSRVMIASGVLMSLGVAATASPTLAEQFTLITNVAVVLNIFFYASGCILLVWIDRRPASIALACAGIAFGLWILALSGTLMLEIAAGAVLLATLAYLLVSRRTATA